MKVLVTGASRGIGRATAKHFAKLGHNVVISARSKAPLEELAQEVGGVPVVADLSKPEEVKRLYAECGELDVVVNNAAMIRPKSFMRMTEEDWDTTLNLNLRSVVLSCRLAFEAMEGRGGSIVNVSSLGGLQNTQKFLGFSAYTVSKAAVISLTECLAVEGRSQGIRVNAIAPGAVDTQMLQEAAPGLKTSTQPEDVAVTLVNLALDPSLTGTTLPIWSNE